MFEADVMYLRICLFSIFHQKGKITLHVSTINCLHFSEKHPLVDNN